MRWGAARRTPHRVRAGLFQALYELWNCSGAQSLEKQLLLRALMRIEEVSPLEGGGCLGRPAHLVSQGTQQTPKEHACEQREEDSDGYGCRTHGDSPSIVTRRPTCLKALGTNRTRCEQYNVPLQFLQQYADQALLAGKLWRKRGSSRG